MGEVKMAHAKEIVERTIQIHEKEIELLNRDLHYITSEVTQEVILQAIKTKKDMVKHLKYSRYFGNSEIKR
jgi:hypothetical protein